jgi:hypothetical protein
MAGVAKGAIQMTDRIRLTRRARNVTMGAAIGAWLWVGAALALHHPVMMGCWVFTAIVMTLLTRHAQHRLLRLYELRRLDMVAEDIERLKRAGKPQVCCVYCGELYDAIDLATLQGYGCASTVVCDRTTGVWYIESFYGSAFDLSLHRFVGVDPMFEMDPVCDTCVKSMLEGSRIVLERSTMTEEPTSPGVAR